MPGEQRLEVGERVELGQRERGGDVRVLLEGGGAEQPPSHLTRGRPTPLDSSLVSLPSFLLSVSQILIPSS